MIRTGKYLGIDPGMSGAIAVVDGSGQLHDYCLCPKTVVGKSKRVDIPTIALYIRSQKDIAGAYIEKVGAMPGQGVSSMFSFGHAAGAVEGCVAAMGIPITHITPQAWKKRYGLIGADKDAPRSKAALKYPDESVFTLKGKGQAVADAVFIALAGMDVSL